MKILKKVVTSVIVSAFVGNASAALIYDQNLANGVFFGSGNSNGGFTVETQNGIEIGLRGKLRFDSDNLPKSIYNSNGDGTYSFDAIAPPTGFGWNPNSPSSAIWNVDWSIDTSGTIGGLAAYRYLFEIDFDPSIGTNFFTFDPTYLGNDNAVQNETAQNSWNMEFFNGPGFEYLNTANGLFDVRLSAFDGNGGLVASSSIQIIQGQIPVPAPAGIVLFLMAGAGLALRRVTSKA
jgi:hypothetical protein